MPLTAATTMAGQSPRAMRQASTGTNERVTSPTHGSLISTQVGERREDHERDDVDGEGRRLVDDGGHRDSGRRGADEAYVERDGRAFPHGRLVMTDQF